MFASYRDVFAETTLVLRDRIAPPTEQSERGCGHAHPSSERLQARCVALASLLVATQVHGVGPVQLCSNSALGANQYSGNKNRLSSRYSVRP